MLMKRTSVTGPRLPSWAVREVGSDLGYTGRAANVVPTAALDPNRSFARLRVFRNLAGSPVASVHADARAALHRKTYGYGQGLLRGARMEDRAFAEGQGPDPATKDSATAFVGFPEEDPLLNDR